MRLPHGPILTAAEMRAAEQAAVGNGVTLYDLMERAGAAVAEAVWRFGGGRPTLILCGPGNNGGDGYVAARLLAARGLDVRVAALREPRAPEAVEARSRWTGPVESLDDAEPAPVLVDALFGTGLARPLEDAVVTPLHRLREAAKFVIAIDVPSGVGTDDGAGMGGITADVTLALGALKPAHCLQPAVEMCGAIKVAEIGLKIEAFDTWTMSCPAIWEPSARKHKYTRGLVAIVGGRMGGAAMLAARAAMRLAGYTVIVGARRSGPDALVHRRWSDVENDAKIGAVLIGPGLGRDDDAKAKLDRALATKHPLVLDGDALHLLSAKQLRERDGIHILTPHDGEFEKLFGVLSGSRIDRARAAAAASRSIVVLKGATTVIAAPDGRVTAATAAPGWLASAGTGDVLAGIAAARLAAIKGAFRAAGQAVWLHSEAARLAGPALTADDLPRHIPAAVSTCL